MNREAIWFMAGVFSLAATQVALGQSVTQPQCYENEKFMKFLDDEKLVTIYNGTIPDNKVQEIMMSKDRRIFTVVYDKASDNNAKVAKTYCVTSVINDVTFNDVAIEFLSQLLEKAKGTKT